MNSASIRGAIQFEFIINNASSWPPAETSLVSRNQVGEGIILLSAHSDGHFSVGIETTTGESIGSADFGRVLLRGTGKCVLFYTWDLNDIHLYAGGIALQPYEPDVAPREIELIPLANGPSSLVHPGASQACQTWITNRAAKFGPIKPRDGRRMKSVDEQAKDLRTSIANLRIITASISNNQGLSSLVGYLATELRALTHWENDARKDGGYNPLLLRMASKRSLPLPVYGWRDLIAKKVPIARQPDFFIHNSGATLNQISPGQHLMDLQEWLKEDIVVVRLPQNPPATVERRLSTKTLISEASNSLGVSHYDEDVSHALSMMREMVFHNMDLLAMYLCCAAMLVADLGEWVLNDLARHSIIAL
ncbi:hypothetical protein [Paludisphaera borealis]|uniref:Uncharacterized protein n=1 Tax=Paludisphaera borealis TaxID=1387353 RepID=A0A1U7CSV4_9BACT|nr:hypothetical protein [Paludisphaera borealis]APW62030.1 hypothetical protein BSF38_03562 [Paludisphaera borealis]